MFTLRQIVNSLPFKFSKGDSVVLKNMMLKDDNEFLRFRGKEQFDNKVKALHPEIDINELYDDYFFAYKKSYAIQRLCWWYENHGELLLKFNFQESMDSDANITGSEFKVLDGLIRSAKDVFWNKYLPPNFSNDASYVNYLSCTVGRYEETAIPKNLPESNFECDLNGLFLSHIKPIESTKTNTESGSSWLLEWGIDIKKLSFEAALEIFQNDGTILPDEDKEKIRKKIDDNLK